jgi:hypothetical protein
MAIYGTLGGQDSTFTGYPSIRPTLDLNFAQTKTLDPRVTFYRDSLATYTDSLGIVRTVPANVPRFDHDPTTGESLGLLIEESRTNLYTYSDQFDNAAWTKNQVTVTANQGIAPDGTLTADLVTTNTVNSYNTLDQLPTLSANTNYCYSVFVKLVSGSGTSSRATLGSANSGISPVYASWGLQLDTLAEATDGNIPTTRGYISYPNGWYRIYMVLNTSGQTNANVGIRFGTGNIDTVSTFYVWGAQLELGSFPTSYIPTTTSTVTRSADIPFIEGNNFTSFYNNLGGTVFVDVHPITQSGYFYSFGTSNYLQSFNFANSGATQFVASFNYNTYGTYGGTVPTYGGYLVNTSNKIAVSFDSTQAKICSNGKAVSTGSGTTPLFINFDRLALGGNIAWDKTYTGQALSYIKRFMYYPKRLPDAQLQNLTAL